MMTNRKLNARVRQREFTARVKNAYDAAAAHGVTDRPMLIQRIMVRLPELAEGEDYDFYITGTAVAVRALLEKFARTEALTDGDDETTLPGFEHIHARYNIMRGGMLLQVPTPEMTIAEVRAKAKEVRRQGFGMLKQADELERYADMREAEEADEHRPEA